MKYCTACGKENDDQAAFCTSCGHQFEGQAQPSIQQPAAPAPPATLFTAERGSGAHAHIISDIYLKDSSGKAVLIAKKQSMLHENYDVVDGAGAPAGFIETKRHLTSSTVQAEDIGRAVQASMKISSVHMGRGIRPPGQYPIEDASGAPLASIEFQEGWMSFAVAKPDGSPVFSASISGGQGFRQEMSALSHENYSISLYDQGFPPALVLFIMVAIDVAMHS